MVLHLHAVQPATRDRGVTRSLCAGLNFDDGDLPEEACTGLPADACAAFVAKWDWMDDAMLQDAIARNTPGDTVFPELKAARAELALMGLR